MNPSKTVDGTGGSAVAFNALADPMRLAILRDLAAGPRCVCELEADLHHAQSLLSYHLRILREAGLVAASRRGRRIDYRLQRGSFRALQGEIADLGGGTPRSPHEGGGHG